VRIGELIDHLSDWDQEAEVKISGEGTVITLEPGRRNQVVLTGEEESMYNAE